MVGHFSGSRIPGRRPRTLCWDKYFDFSYTHPTRYVSTEQSFHMIIVFYELFHELQADLIPIGMSALNRDLCGHRKVY